MRMPDPGPLGETFFEARVRAMVAALLLKRPLGGWVESVVTFAIHLFCFFAGIGDLLYLSPLYIRMRKRPDGTLLSSRASLPKARVSFARESVTRPAGRSFPCS